MSACVNDNFSLKTSDSPLSNASIAKNDTICTESSLDHNKVKGQIFHLRLSVVSGRGGVLFWW